MASVWCGEDADKGAGQLTRIEEGHRVEESVAIVRYFLTPPNLVVVKRTPLAQTSLLYPTHPT